MNKQEIERIVKNVLQDVNKMKELTLMLEKSIKYTTYKRIK